MSIADIFGNEAIGKESLEALSGILPEAYLKVVETGFQILNETQEYILELEEEFYVTAKNIERLRKGHTRINSLKADLALIEGKHGDVPNVKAALSTDLEDIDNIIERLDHLL